MKHIVVFGAGKSATVLIEFLKNLSIKRKWNISIADGNYTQTSAKIGVHAFVKAVELDIHDELKRNELVQQASIVISLLPPQLHFLIAKTCLAFGKNLLTASYIDEETKTLASEIKEKKLLFLYEMGLDPGIDHMSAMQIIDSIQHKGGKITSFKSHCGGLVAKEFINNPWKYKISWNPRNIILAGKSGAIFLENQEEKKVDYSHLFNANNVVEMPNGESFSFYPNRDSLSYIETYHLQNISTFIRTTLREKEFSLGWKNIVEFKLTEEEKVYETENLTIADFYKKHFERFGFNNWKEEYFNQKFSKIEQEQFLFIGIENNETIINKGLCSAADVLQFVLEEKLALAPNDKDMIIMLHEFEYELENQKHNLKSFLKVIGEDNKKTAMAKTVGLPLGIAAELILDEKINETGLQIPIKKTIYEPVLQELKNHHIVFEEFKD